MSWQGSAMWVHRGPRGPVRCWTSLLSAHVGRSVDSSATGEPFGDRRIVTGLAPQDDLGAPRVDERAAEPVELAPVVVAPQLGRAAGNCRFENAVLVVVVGDQDVDARSAP